MAFLDLLLRFLYELRLSDMAAAVTGLFIFTVAVQRLSPSKGPTTWPILGIIPTLFYNLSGDIYEWLTAELLAAGGTFEFHGMWFGKLYGVITLDPSNIEYMLKTNFVNFPKGAYFRERFADFLGNGIFNADDLTWREQRRAATAEMHSSRFVQYSFRTVRDLVQLKLLPLLSKLSAGDVKIDLQDVLLRFTFDNICTAAFGVDPGCLSLDLPEVTFARAFETATELSLFRFTVPPAVWKTMKILDIGTEQKLRSAVKIVHEFAENTVARRRAELRKLGDGVSSDRCDLLSRLMEVEDAHENNSNHLNTIKSNNDKRFKFSDEFLKDFCISFILAGRDTSSVALAWFFWLLYQHRNVEERILDELKKIVSLRKKTAALEDYEEKCSGHVVFTAEELKQMEYLQAALSESLRLYPSVPIDFKEVLKDDVLPDGTAVRNGTRVIYSIYSMARSEAIWGKDCREFRPERWFDKDGAFVGENQFKYAVFNAGPRLCVGKKFAYTQMKMVAASMLLRYHVEVVDGQVVAPKLNTTLYMKNGLLVQFKPRDVDGILLHHG